MTLTDARTLALEKIEQRRIGLLGQGAEIATGVFAPIDADSRVDWLGADRYADVICANAATYTSELLDAAGAPVLHVFASAAELQTGALVCLARYQTVQGGALVARAAVRSATTVEAVDAALSAYLGG